MFCVCVLVTCPECIDISPSDCWDGTEKPLTLIGNKHQSTEDGRSYKPDGLFFLQ